MKQQSSEENGIDSERLRLYPRWRNQDAEILEDPIWVTLLSTGDKR